MITKAPFFAAGTRPQGYMRTRAALVACLLFVAVLALALPAVAQGDTGSDANESVDDVTVGESISGFMQSTEASAEGDVDQGLYQARYETANESERTAIVEERTANLEARLTAVEDRIDRIQADRDEMDPIAYRARMSAAAAQLRSLEASANGTERDAATVGVNTTRLETLRNRAAELSGREVAAIARNLAGVTPDGPNGSGPPEDPGRGDGQGSPNGTPGDSGNGTGASDGADTGDSGQGTGDAGTGNNNAGTGNGDAGSGDGNTGTGGGQGDGDNQGAGTGRMSSLN